MREAFLAPRNVLRMEEAMLSLLGGDIFGRTPIWTSLRLFKAVYYLISIANLGRTLRALRSRAVSSTRKPARPRSAKPPTPRCKAARPI